MSEEVLYVVVVFGEEVLFAVVLLYESCLLSWCELVSGTSIWDWGLLVWVDCE